MMCPRCNTNELRVTSNQSLGTNALSRTTREPDDDPIWVCSDCGQAEAFEDFLAGGATPISDWPLSPRMARAATALIIHDPEDHS